MQKWKIRPILHKIENIVLMSCLGIMGIFLFAQIVLRYCFKIPLIWSEEAARFLYIWITFLGIGYGIRNKSHIEMTVFFNLFPKKIKEIVPAITNAFMIFCFLYFIPGSIKFLQYQNFMNSSAIGINMSIVYSVIPIGMIVAAVYLIEDTCLILSNFFRKGGRDLNC